MAVKITSFEAENVKRVKAVAMEPSESGLTVIGGRNNQGKTSVLDAIAWALGGDRNKPSSPNREGSVNEPRLKVTLSNGLVVERKGKSSALKVIDPEGRKSGQTLLDGFVEQLALNLPKFMDQSSSEKARTLLNIIGVGEQLYELEAEEQKLYNQRTTVGQMERQKRGAAEEMQHYPDAPAEVVSASELIQKQQAILAKNGENQRKRDMAMSLRREREDVKRQLEAVNDDLQKAVQRQQDLSVRLAKLDDDCDVAAKTAEQLHDESTAEIEASLAEIDRINVMVRTNQNRAAAFDEADAFKEQYDALSAMLDDVRTKKMALLNGADLPLAGLTVEGKELVYNGAKWDCMSGSDQLKVATAVVRKLKPECGFVLVDKLEQMDSQTLAEFGAWAESEGLQVIGTRVSTGDECSIVIEDGYSQQIAEPTPSAANAAADAAQPVFAPATPQWVM